MPDETGETSERPIRLVVADDLRRTRPTVLFRLPLAVPLLLWLALWSLAALPAAVALWAAVTLRGRGPAGLHGFLARLVRYSTQVGAYLLLAADPYPWFRPRDGYPVDVQVGPPAPQRRTSALVRLLLAAPALVLAALLTGGVSLDAGGPSPEEAASWWWSGNAGGAAATAAFLAWFASLARGRAPRGLRDLAAYALGYGAETAGYALLLTGRYPSSDPARAEEYAELPPHPVRVEVRDGLERLRLGVAFRLLLALPHLAWLALWSLAALPAAACAWAACLAAGRVPGPLHRFLAAYVRYGVQVSAYLSVVGRRFPGFTGAPGYGIDVVLDPPGPQRRAAALARLPLALPALLVSAALAWVLLAVAILGWWYALAAGRMPEGLRNLGASCLRYEAQTAAYLLLLTGRYPYASPVLRGRPVEPEGGWPPSPAALGAAA